MGCYLYNCGMDHCLEFMAKIGINLDCNADLNEVFKRRRDINNNEIRHFTPQRDAFVSEEAR